MIDAREFNLLPYVHKKAWLSAKLSAVVVLLYLVMLLLIFFLVEHNAHKTQAQLALSEQQIGQATQRLKQYITPERDLVAVLPGPVALDAQGFYQEFSALSHLHIPGLWLTRVTIDRDKQFVRIRGKMIASDKLNQLLSFLSANPIFKPYDFKGIDVSEAQLPPIPQSLRAQTDELKVNKIYSFVVQTQAFKADGGR